MKWLKDIRPTIWVIESSSLGKSKVLKIENEEIPPTYTIYEPNNQICEANASQKDIRKDAINYRNI